MELIIFELTQDQSFNYFASIPLTIALIIVPLAGAISLIGSK
jgi:hypothetical protein